MSEWTSGQGNIFKWEKPGDTIAGTITGATVRDGKDLQGQPVRNRIIDVTTDDGQDWTIYAKDGQMTSALGRALREAGREAPTEGDKVAIKFDHTEPSSTVGFNDKKVYVVQYKATAAAAPSSDDLL